MEEKALENLCDVILTELKSAIEPTKLAKRCANYLKITGNESPVPEDFVEAVAFLLKISIEVENSLETNKELAKISRKPQFVLKKKKSEFWNVVEELSTKNESSIFSTLKQKCLKHTANEECLKAINAGKVDKDVLKVAANVLELPIVINDGQTPDVTKPDPVSITNEDELWKLLEKNHPEKGIEQLKKECLEYVIENEHSDADGRTTETSDDEISKTFKNAANFERMAIELKENPESEGKLFEPTTVHDVTLKTDGYKTFRNAFNFDESHNKEKKEEEARWIKLSAKALSTFIFFGAVGLGTITTKSTLLVLANAYTQDYSMSTCPKIFENGEEHYNYSRYTVMLILMTCLCTPDALSFLYSIQRVLKTKEDPIWRTTENQTTYVSLAIALGAIPEVLHAIGLTFLVLEVFPNVDATVASMIFALVVSIPAVVLLWSPPPIWMCRQKRSQPVALLAASLVFLVFGYAATLFMALKSTSAVAIVFSLLSPLLMSFRYVENFFEPNEDYYLMKVKKELQNRPYKTSALYAIIRLVIIVIFCFVIHVFIEDNGAVVTQDGSEEIQFVQEYNLTDKCSRITTAFRNAGIVNIISSFMTFIFGLVACQAAVQNLALNLPIALAYPAMVLFTSMFSAKSNEETLMDFLNFPVAHSEVKPYINWKAENEYSGNDWAVLGVGTFFCFLGFFITTLYVWKGNKQARARIEKLFTKPVYNILSEEIPLNRRVSYETNDEAGGEDTNSRNSFIYICTTIYHETEAEMLQILTSIMRLVEHSRKQTGNNNFDFEVHIWIDDAIDKAHDTQSIANRYVRSLLKTIPEAARRFEIKPENIKVLLTPYGGRYEYDLEGKKLYVHLKDTRKVKQKKRWSQCMYLYYILKHKKLQQKGKDTYILALDGDVDFKPEAVTYVLNVMKKHGKLKEKEIGAVCGRIHPLGYGPVYWYQRFEYAVGHWLQKTAEDVYGCVLCSPGCFSLFRTDALEDDNVVATYSKESTEGKHKIQYDQGEDRWLCTLLLKAGKRIEYAANSDSYTNAPTEFKEFFNQRRRWAPSTMANILDILLDSKIARKNNDDIMFLYIVYQWALMAASLLGPSTVVLVIQGALQYVFGMDAIGALMLALIPVVIYVVICYTTSPDFQIAVAYVLTLAYAVLMVVVFVGVIGQMVQSTLNPSSVFLLFMIGLFTFTGLLHPNEITSLFHGIVYYLCVPSAFIFLPIYSYCNMHIVSWGTRESVANKNKSNNKNESETEHGSYNCSFGNICKCMLCVNPPTPGRNKTTQTEESPVQESSANRHKWKKLKKRQTIINRAAKAFSQSQTEIDLHKEVTRRGKGITAQERAIWTTLTEGFLKPSGNENAMEIEKEIKNLRNLMSGAYILINGLWLALTFSLAMIIDDVNILYEDKYGNKIVLNPLAFLFLIFFLVILVLQFVAMLFHRLDTFIHLMAQTEWLQTKNSVAPQNNVVDVSNPSTSGGGPGSTGEAFMARNTGQNRESAV